MSSADVSSADVFAVLTDALRAPSAHNAQPWRLVALDGDGLRYRLRYAFADKLLADPDDRDAMLAMGAFYETLALAARRAGWVASFTPADGPGSESGGGDGGDGGDGLDVGEVVLRRATAVDPADPLAEAAARRMTNRTPYRKGVALPSRLRGELESLGCTLLSSGDVAPLVSKASVMAWRDPRFVEDLREWTRFSDDEPDGLTCSCLRLSWLDRRALRFALWRGRLPAWLAWVYAQRDVRLTRASSCVAVLSAPSREPMVLFEVGRRLLRSWVSIVAAGHAYHPISIVIDQATAPELSALAGVDDAVAIFRMGAPTGPAVPSRRRALSAVMIRGG
jgi:hypothetical protein